MKTNKRQGKQGGYSRSRREFFKKLGKGGLTALAYGALGGFVAGQMSGRAVANGEPAQRCWEWLWFGGDWSS